MYIRGLLCLLACLIEGSLIPCPQTPLLSSSPHYLRYEKHIKDNQDDQINQDNQHDQVDLDDQDGKDDHDDQGDQDDKDDQGD